MKTLWRTYAAKIDALSLRERAMVFVSVVAVVAYALNMLLIDPSATRSKALSTKMAQQQSEMQALLVKIAAMEKQRAGTDAGNLARRDDVKRQIVAIDGQVKDMQHNLVAAQNMKAVLQEVLARNSRVQLVAMQTLPVTPLVEKREKTDKPDASAGVGKPPDRQDKQDKGGDLYRRGMYVFWRRSAHYPSFATFDAPNREVCTFLRQRTQTPLQSLVLMNDPAYVEAARGLAQRVFAEAPADLNRRLVLAFRHTLGRPPQADETALLKKTFDQQLANFQGDPKSAEALLKVGESPAPTSIDKAELAAMTAVANVLLNLNEAITK